jgi:hypothetical protein
MTTQNENNLLQAEVTSRMTAYLAASQRVEKLRDALRTAEAHCEEVTKALDNSVQPRAIAAVLAHCPHLRERDLGVLNVKQEPDQQFRVTVGCWDEDDPWPRSRVHVMLNLACNEASLIPAR